LLLDVVAVIAFVGIGVSVHTRGGPDRWASVAWPFLVGLGVGWAAVVTARRPLATPRSGVGVTVVTVGVGMTLRVVSGQGTAVAFVVVALCFLGAVMIGWRSVAPAADRVRRFHRVRSADRTP
jgi:hypothetical protein